MDVRYFRNRHSKQNQSKNKLPYFFLVKTNILPQIVGITIIIIAVIRASSCCSGVGNHSNEPVNKYKSPKKKTIHTIIHKNIRTAFISSPPWSHCTITAAPAQSRNCLSLTQQKTPPNRVVFLILIPNKTDQNNEGFITLQINLAKRYRENHSQKKFQYILLSLAPHQL